MLMVFGQRSSFAQIQSLEQNVSQLAKSLENSRQAYQNLNFQYGEQCGMFPNSALGLVQSTH